MPTLTTTCSQTPNAYFFPPQPTNASLLGNGERPKVNLDVTTLVALVSDLTHGGCWHAFQEPLIQELADQERDRPLVTEVEQFLKGRC